MPLHDSATLRREADAYIAGRVGESTDDEAPPPIPTPELSPAALYGVVGDIVRAIEPHTEAAPAGILMTLLTGLGCLIGRGPHQMIDGARHGTNLFTLLVGPSSDGRKGTCVARARAVLRAVDDDFTRSNIATGLSSGQGVIYHVRDAAEAPPPAADGKPPKPADPGVTDKRLLVIEDEMASALRPMRGQENTLSQVLRSAWDGTLLRTLTRANPMKATDPHIAIVGQITPAELRISLGDVEFENGFLNRFLFCYVERVRLLPHGGHPPAARLDPLITKLEYAVGAARRVGEMTFDRAARSQWESVYPVLTTGHAGKVGAATRRGAAQVRRIAMLYTLLDGAHDIGTAHLDAALALWDYSVASARYVFGAASFSALAERFDGALDDAGLDGLDMTALRTASGSNAIPTSKMREALDELRAAGRARVTFDRSGGRRPREVWRHIRHALAEKNTTLSTVGEIGRIGNYEESGIPETGHSPNSPIPPASRSASYSPVAPDKAYSPNPPNLPTDVKTPDEQVAELVGRGISQKSADAIVAKRMARSEAQNGNGLPAAARTPTSYDDMSEEEELAAEEAALRAEGFSPRTVEIQAARNVKQRRAARRAAARTNGNGLSGAA